MPAPFAPAEPSPFQVPVIPAWMRPAAQASSEADAAFLAGAAIFALDTVVRAQAGWAGAWRRRLALSCAVAGVRFTGRSENEGELRDAWVLRASSADAGPAGNILSVYRRLATREPLVNPVELQEMAALLGIRWHDDFSTLPARLDNGIRSARTAPLAAASLLSQICIWRPDAELLGWWLADWLLAKKMHWERPVPLLLAQRYSAAFTTNTGRGRVKPGEPMFERAVCMAVAQGAAEACRLAGDIARRADRLAAITPKLRAKGAGDVIALLLDDDAVAGSLQTARLSRWASRRLFERLIELDAIRELSGRPTFRIYGL